MKLQKSLPQNAAFFERYAELITSLSSVAIIAQIITGVCEIGILYGLVQPSLTDFLPPQYVGTLATVLAVVCAALLQIGLKKVFPYSIRAILFKRFQSLDLWFSMGVFLLTVTLLSVSVYLSWQGSKDIADFAVAPPQYKTTIKADSTKNADIATAQRMFTTDSTTIEAKYKGKSEAIKSDLQSQIASLETKAASTAKVAPLWSKELKNKAVILRGVLSTKLASLDSDKAIEIESKAADLRRAMDKANDRADNETATIKTENATLKANADQRKDRYKGYIGYFTLMCYVFFLSIFALNEIYHKGANIETKPLPSQRHFAPSVLSEFWETVKEKLDVFFRTKIQSWSDRTPPQPIPSKAHLLYNFQFDLLTDTLKIETESEKVRLPVKVPFKASHIPTTEQAEPTPEKERRQIGFVKNDKAENTETVKDSINDKHTTKIVNENRVCHYCGVNYIHGHHKQKYCSELCRVEAWEKRTGKRFSKVVKS